MISISLLANKDSQSSSSLLELDMGSDSHLYESTSQSSSMELEDEVLASMLGQLENGMFTKRQEGLTHTAIVNHKAKDDPPAPPAHSQATPEAARKFLYQMGESLSCECMFTAADLLGAPTEG